MVQHLQAIRLHDTYGRECRVGVRVVHWLLEQLGEGPSSLTT
jgi:hypothetical protein